MRSPSLTLTKAWQPTSLTYLGATLLGLGLGLLTLFSPILALITILGLSFSLAALTTPILLGYLMIATTTLAGGMARGRLLPILTPNEISLVLTIGILLPTFLLHKKLPNSDTKPILSAFLILVLGTVLIPVINFLLRGISLDLNNAFKLVGPIQYFLLFWAFTIIAKTETNRRQLVQWMLACGTIVAIVGLLQAARVSFILTILNRWFSSIHLDDSLTSQAGRITSLIGAWNALGMFMMVCVLLAWATLPTTQSKREHLITLSSLILCALTLLASGSFSGNLGMLLGLILITLLTKRVQKMLPMFFLSFLGIALFFLLAQSFLLPLIEQRLAFQFTNGFSLMPRTLVDRFDIWRDVFLPPIRQHFPQPVYPKVPAHYAWLYEESQYIMLLFRTGLAGLLSHLLWVGIMIHWLVRKFQQSDGFAKSLTASVLTILILLSIAGFTNAVFNYSGSIDYMWILFALVANSQTQHG